MRTLSVAVLFSSICFLSSPHITTSPFLIWGEDNDESSPYSIIIDGGSTGSRLHIFEFVANETLTSIVRRGSARADVPLSAFSTPTVVNATAVAEHLLPAFQYAASVIPAHFHATTRVLYQATAGMRLLTDDEQDAVYDAMYQGLKEAPEFVFALEREDIDTLSGDLEGFYGAIAANYLKGTIDAQLQLVGADEHGPIGALDMGGSSTQIVFLPSRDKPAEETCAETHSSPECHKATEAELPSRLNGQDFFATSYLSYGVDQFRERLWSTWIQQHQQANTDQCDAKVLSNPCAFRGFLVEWEGYTLIGTGDAQACVEQVQAFIPHPHKNDVADLGKHVGGVEHPPVRGKFFAMSLYFFALDSLRELSRSNAAAFEALNQSWPTPSIQELFDALGGLCSRSWHGDLHEIRHNAHAFTRAEVLPHRCLEAVYMVTLLRDGFGFAPESRDITFTFLVNGSEVEWTLGMALALRHEQAESEIDIVPEFGFDDTPLKHRSSLLKRVTKHLFATITA